MFLFTLCGNDLISIPELLSLSQPRTHGLDCWVATNLPPVKCSLMMPSDTPFAAAWSRIKMAWLIFLLLHNTGEAERGSCCPVSGTVGAFLCALTHLNAKAEERPSLTAVSPCSDLWMEDGTFWLLVRTVVPMHYYIFGFPLYSLVSKENTPHLPVPTLCF